MRKIVAIFAALLLLPAGVWAQLKKNRIGSTSKQMVSVALGVNHPVFELKTKHGPHAQAAYTYFFLPEVGLQGFADYNFFWGDENFQGHFASLGAKVIYNFFIYKSGRRENAKGSFIPERIYLHGGVGVSGFFCSPKPQFIDGCTAMFPVGLGFSWAVSDSWSLGLEAAYNFTLSDKIDNIKSGKMPDCYPTLDLTLTYKIPDARRSGTGFGYKKGKNKCDPIKGCAITYQ